MKKTMKIKGMMCPHCEARVKKLLQGLDAVTKADVSHEQGTAIASVSEDIPDAILKELIEANGYTLESIVRS